MLLGVSNATITSARGSAHLWWSKLRSAPQPSMKTLPCSKPDMVRSCTWRLRILKLERSIRPQAVGGGGGGRGVEAQMPAGNVTNTLLSFGVAHQQVQHFHLPEKYSSGVSLICNSYRHGKPAGRHAVTPSTCPPAPTASNHAECFHLRCGYNSLSHNVVAPTLQPHAAVAIFHAPRSGRCRQLQVVDGRESVAPEAV